MVGGEERKNQEEIATRQNSERNSQGTDGSMMKQVVMKTLTDHSNKNVSDSKRFKIKQTSFLCRPH